MLKLEYPTKKTLTTMSIQYTRTKLRTKDKEPEQ